MRHRPTPTVEQGISAPLRRYLYVTAGITGAAIMIIEILGAKMLAPFLGTSHFVWTAQIAVTLVALAAGYYAGGRLVDRSPRLGPMYGCVLLAAIYLAVTIALVEPVAYWCLKFKLAMGSLLASGFLFFVPLALLAMVGPFFVRVLAVSMNNVGGTIGRLTAISTLGSFAGTILIGYVLIPYLPNSVTMFLTAGILMVVVAAYFTAWETRGGSKLPVSAGIALGLLFGYRGISKEWSVRYTSADELYRANSNFGLLQVMQTKAGDRRFYLNDYLIQNTYDAAEKKSLALFTYMLHDLAWAYTPDLKSALCIGMGVGIVPMQLAQEGVQVDVVEINPAVVKIATNHFDCRIEKFNLFFGDGRYFVNQTEKQYDSVILDAFLGDSSPSHLMTREAFGSIRRILKPGGTLVINSFGDFEPGRDFFTASLEKTLKDVFAGVRAHAAGNGNVFFVASDRTSLAPLRQPDLERTHIVCQPDVQRAFNSDPKADLTRGIVLTDDYNPIEFHDAANREEHRRRLAFHMKGL